MCIRDRPYHHITGGIPHRGLPVGIGDNLLKTLSCSFRINISLKNLVCRFPSLSLFINVYPVSYTHLDVYKRQDGFWGYGAFPERL